MVHTIVTQSQNKITKNENNPEQEQTKTRKYQNMKAIQIIRR